MADLKALEERLKVIGCNFRFWGRAELRELADVLMPNELVQHCVNGQYQGGFAMLVATDQRVLLIDKKPMYLSLEDIRYDMISEVDYNHRMMDANVHLCTPNKSLRFVAYNQGRLRKLFHFVQTRVMEVRQQYQQMASQQYQPVQQYAQPLPAQVAQQPFEPYLQSQQVPVTQLRPAASRMYQPVVAPIISAYTRLPMLSRQRRFLGSRALNTPMSSIYTNQQ